MSEKIGPASEREVGKPANPKFATGADVGKPGD